MPHPRDSLPLRVGVHVRGCAKDGHDLFGGTEELQRNRMRPLDRSRVPPAIRV